MRRISRKRRFESLVQDPHDLILSLVDFGSLDVEDALIACVKEMSDAECKRVLNSLSLPECCEEPEVEDEYEPIEDTDDIETLDDTVDLEDTDEEEPEIEAEDVDAEECRRRDLESRIRHLERTLRRR